MGTKNQIKREIRADIDEIDSALNNDKISFQELKEIHIKLDGKYQVKIQKWGQSMYGWINNNGFDYTCIGTDSIKENLYTMKSKLEGYLQDYDYNYVNSGTHPQILNYNHNESINTNQIDLDIGINFEKTKENIKNMESLTNEEMIEILKQIKILEEIYKSKDTRKNKWEKTKRIAQWLLDKSVDVAIQIIPIIMGIVK